MRDWTIGCAEVIHAVVDERIRQVHQYGLNEGLENGTGPKTAWLPLGTECQPAEKVEEYFRHDYEGYEEEVGQVTWLHLVREELAEAFKEDDEDRLEEELIQVAALCVSWVENLRRKKEEIHGTRN